ncbi:MAG: EamA family transporter [Streptococcaceae bacterium]|jgi:UDP-N-acetylmuramyl pentapeptide phosphotransferase/UDP-N-acetylglucosamine-1-phosphate transferase|nr:EamA family transporter [Streptococcaceae bacterium]
MAYMLTFFFLGLIIFLWLNFLKKQKFVLFERQGEAHRLGAAALIASYAVISIVMGHVFLNERLTKWQYIAVLLVLVGTAIIGFYDF